MSHRFVTLTVSLNVSFFVAFFLPLPGLDFPVAAFANPAAPAPVRIDYAKQTLSLEGVFKRTKTDRRSGLEAELEARREAIARLQQVLEASCGGSAQLEGTLMPDWKTSFRSQGSVIHADHTLRLLLLSELKSLFKAVKELAGTKPAALKDKDGKPLVLALAPVLAEQTACGTLAVKSGGKGTKVFLAPAPAAADAVVVQMQVEAGGALSAANAEGAAVLDASNLGALLSQAGEKLAVLPVR